MITDHKPLTAILGPKKGIPSLAAARLQRWAVLLSAYHYDIEFKATDEHANADGLSRLPLPFNSSDSRLLQINSPSLYNLSQLEALPVTASNIASATGKDSILSRVLRYTKTGWQPTEEDVLKPYQQRSQEITVERDCLLWGTRVIIPVKYQSQILKELHREHPGCSRMKRLARSYVWWPGMDKDIENIAKSCHSCQSNKHAPPPAPLHPWTWPAKPWQRIHIDFAGPFLGKSFLVIVDAHSKWPEIFDMPTTSATQTIATLRQLFASYGLPEQIVSDNGPQFTSEEFADFMKKNGIKHTRCAPYHPASNGAVERFIQTFKQAMKASEHDGRSLAHRLANFLLSYRATPHSTTNQSPSSLFLNRTLRTRLSLVHPDTEQHVFRKQTEQESQHNLHAKERHFTTGQEVMVRNLRPGSKWVSGCITRQLGPVTYLIATKAGQIWKRHIVHIHDNSFVPTPADIELQENTETDSDNFLPSLPIETSITEDTPEETTTPRYPSRPRIPPERYM